MQDIIKVTTFRPHVGKIFHFKGTRFSFPLDRIIVNRKQKYPGAKRQPFTLIFAGAREHGYLSEGVYECEVEGGSAFSFHIMPIHTPRPDRQEYQAVFN